ncbi:hypothetical protein BH10PSE5_BH10PSE5_12060 [soil metagenome]
MTQTATGRRRRWVVVPLSVLAHLMVFLFLRAAPPDLPRPFEQGAANASLFDGRDQAASVTHSALTAPALAKPSAPAKPPPPPPDIVPQFIDGLPPLDPTAEPDLLNGEVAISVATAASAAAGQSCQLAGWLQQALQQDTGVQIALAKIPRPARSVSNALMLWDGQWVEAPAAATGIALIRGALRSGIQAAPETCRDEPMRGPVLITLVDDTGSTLLAVGSGEWRWADLLPTPYDAPPS